MLYKAHLQGSQGQDCITQKPTAGRIFQTNHSKGSVFRGLRNGPRPPLGLPRGICKWRRSRSNSPLAKRRKLHVKSHSHRYVSCLGKRCLGNRTAYRKGLWSDCITIGRAVLLLRDFARPWRALFFIKPLPSLCPCKKKIGQGPCESIAGAILQAF